VRFDIYRNGERVHPCIEAEDERSALQRYAVLNGIDIVVRRDGGGLLYVGEGRLGRACYARRVPTQAEQAEVDAWREQYPGIPFGIPPVLAEAIKSVGGLA